MVYFFFRNLFRVWFQLFYALHVEGHENVPKNGPVVIVSNHISNWDPLSVGSSIERQVHFMAKESLFRIPGIGALLRVWGAFPVKRGTADRNAIRQAMRVLQEGQVLGIFPEGHRSKTGKLGAIFPGAVSFALKGDATVIPVAVIGPYRLFQKLTIRIGKPIDLSTYQNVKATSSVLEEAADVIKRSIEHLLGDGV